MLGTEGDTALRLASVDGASADWAAVRAVFAEGVEGPAPTEPARTGAFAARSDRWVLSGDTPPTGELSFDVAAFDEDGFTVDRAEGTTTPGVVYASGRGTRSAAGSANTRAELLLAQRATRAQEGPWTPRQDVAGRSGRVTPRDASP